MQLAEVLKTNETIHTLSLQEYTGVDEALLRDVRASLAGREMAAGRTLAMHEPEAMADALLGSRTLG